MKKVRDLIILLLLILCLVNLTLIEAFIIFEKYGSVTLSPGEKYNVNIPFFGASKSPMICGKAQTISGENIKGVNVSVFYDTSLVNKSTTDINGQYCIALPEITSNKKYDIFIEYDNQTASGDFIQVANHDYTLDFENNLIFSKSSDNYAALKGAITNEDANIENGRFEINLKYYQNSTWEEIFDYQKYFVNIAPQEIYNVPNNELNVSWELQDDIKTGRYKFYIKTSFNAKERTSNIYFNVTA